METQQGDDWFTRFPPFERFLHFLVVTSFLLLVITGMPLKFYYTDWAKVIFNVLGGAEVARTLHHFGALITFLYFGLHLAKLPDQGLAEPRPLPGRRLAFQMRRASSGRSSAPTR